MPIITNPYTYNGYKYTRKDALVVKGDYYTAMNNTSRAGTFSSNTTKYFYGHYANDDGTESKNPLGLMNYESQSSLTFGFMKFSAIQSGGTPVYYFDLNFIIDGTSTNNASIAKADVYINGSKVSSGVGDYYVQHPSGTTWEIKNIVVASGYTRYSTPALSGTLTAKTACNIYIGRQSTYSFNANGGTGAPGNYTKVYGVGFTVPTTKPTRTGYTFLGWTEGTSGTTIFEPGKTYSTEDKAITFYAKWQANTYTITYKANGGSGSDQTQTATYGTSWTTKNASTFTRTGYTLSSWNTNADGSGTKYSVNTGQTNQQLSNLTLYAQWTANTYYVAYNANGGSGSMSNSTHKYNTSSKLTANAFTKTGYSFAGWNTAANGSGTALSNQQAVTTLTSTNGGTVTLYAQWTINSYTLTIEPNGGTWNSTTSNSTITQNYNTTKAIANPTRTGYTFGGWAKSAYGSLSNSASSNSNFSSSSTSNFGGVYVYNNAGDGTVTIVKEETSDTAGVGSSRVLKITTTASSATPGHGGFTHGFKSAASQTYIHTFIAKIPVGHTVELASNATGDGRVFTWLTDTAGTGKWTTYAYKLVSGSSGNFSTFGYVYLLENSSLPVTWYLGMSDITNITSGSNTFTFGAGNTTMKAIWIPNKYKVVYNANGGYTTPSTTSTTQNVTYDSNFSFKGREYTKPGYAHIGWNTKADGSGTKYTFGASTKYTTVGDYTVYAQWRAATADEQKIYLYNDGKCEALGFAVTSDWYGFKKGVVGAKEFTIGAPATNPSKTMQFKGMIIKNLT